MSEWQSKSLEIFELNSALHRFHSDLIQLERTIKLLPLERRTALQVKMQLEYKAAEANIKIFSDDFHEVESMYHSKLLQDIKALIDSLTQPQTVIVRGVDVEFYGGFFEASKKSHQSKTGGSKNATWREVEGTTANAGMATSWPLPMLDS